MRRALGILQAYYMAQSRQRENDNCKTIEETTAKADPRLEGNGIHRWMVGTYVSERSRPRVEGGTAEARSVPISPHYRAT